MALDARHRSSIYLKFVPLIGEDDANALMSEFPASEADELVTKQFLRAELALTRGELRSELAEFRTEFRSELAALRSELAELRTEGRFGLADLRAELAEFRSEGRTELAALENRLTVRFGAALGAATAILATLITVQ